MNGISPTVIARASELASLSARGENLIVACAVMSAEETKTLEEAVRHGFVCSLVFDLLMSLQRTKWRGSSSKLIFQEMEMLLGREWRRSFERIVS